MIYPFSLRGIVEMLYVEIIMLGMSRNAIIVQELFPCYPIVIVSLFSMTRHGSQNPDFNPLV